MKEVSMLPVLKWAGGKRQLLKKIRHYMPKAYNTYFEPFVGAGAVLFDIAPKHAYINDINTDLVTVYRTLKDQDQFKKLVRLLEIHETNHNDDYYYEIDRKSTRLNSSHVRISYAVFCLKKKKKKKKQN